MFRAPFRSTRGLYFSLPKNIKPRNKLFSSFFKLKPSYGFVTAGISHRSFCTSKPATPPKSTTTPTKSTTTPSTSPDPTNPASKSPAASSPAPTKNSLVNEASLDISIDKGGYHLRVFLPSGPYSLNLRRNATIRSLIQELKSEDRTINSIHFQTLDGYRIARSTSIEQLLGTQWKLSIDDATYIVRTPPRSQLVSFVDVPPLYEQSDSFQRIKEKLISRGKSASTISYAEYLEYCQDAGLSDEESFIQAKILHQLGTVLFFPERPELSNVLFLHPEKISESVESVLNLRAILRTQEQRYAYVQKLKSEIEPLEQHRQALYHRAETFASVIAWTGLIGLCGQFILFARFTWWDYSWDVMEPVTYFTTVAESVFAGYLFYLFSRDDFTYAGFRKRLIDYRFDVLAVKDGFDREKYRQLREDLERNLYEIEVFKTEQEAEKVSLERGHVAQVATP